MNIPIERLFNKNRLDGSILQLLLLFVYTPMGIILMLVRLFISLQLVMAVSVLPKRATITRLMVRCLCGVLGLVVRQEQLHKNPLYEDEEDLRQLMGSNEDHQTRLVVVANHLTPFDHFALSLVMPCVKVSCNGEGIPWPLSHLLKSEVITAQPSSSSSASRLNVVPRRDELFITKLKAFTNAAATEDTLPLLIFPEDATTSGSSALLQYGSWCSQVAGSCPSVACLKVKRMPPLPLKAAGVINSTFTQHLLTLFFCPLTIYTVRYLGRVPRLPVETDEEFSKRLQSVTANALDLKITSYDAGEKVEYVKRCLAAQQNQWTVSPADSLPRTDLQALASQVQEVLPHLPLAAILRDIARTGNVDVTITNFLEGAVPDYNPSMAVLQPSTVSSASNTGSSLSVVAAPIVTPPSTGPINLNTKAASFSSSATDRMMSFHERRNLLLDNALRKYVEKFGINGEKDPYYKSS